MLISTASEDNRYDGKTENFNTTLSTTYFSLYENKLHIHGYDKLLDIQRSDNYIHCSKISTIPSMINKTNDAQNNSISSYLVGYEVNDIDFLTAYNIYEFGTFTVVRTEIVSVIKSRPVIGTFEYRKGLIYKNNFINFTEIYNKDYQLRMLREQFEHEELLQKYFSGKMFIIFTRCSTCMNFVLCRSLSIRISISQ